ncbi:hypothetical protein [Microcoleus sp. AR_TQ3_B6]|uniref:hypothetical protein n=1 Tax=Microcoleus sp. AR_TQ3_B6 TaxID=3055284 RepID=UPI002FD1A919
MSSAYNYSLVSVLGYRGQAIAPVSWLTAGRAIGLVILYQALDPGNILLALRIATQNYSWESGRLGVGETGSGGDWENFNFCVLSDLGMMRKSLRVSNCSKTK